MSGAPAGLGTSTGPAVTAVANLTGNDGGGGARPVASGPAADPAHSQRSVHGTYPAPPIVEVRARRRGEIAGVVHFQDGTERRRAACRSGAAHSSLTTTLRPDAVTCRLCRRGRLWAEAVVVAAAERRVLDGVARREAERRRPDALPWVCSLCEGTGDDGGGRCIECAGYGHVADKPQGVEAVRGPRPPAVMARPCVDCRYRPGSQEDDDGQPPPDETAVFWCHQGVPVVRGEYRPLLWVDGRPVGSKICGAWWDVAICGEDPPVKAARYSD